jgi:CRP-like cAMP-binding protein
MTKGYFMDGKPGKSVARSHFSALRRVALFEGVDDARLDQLAREANPLTVRRGQIVISRGERADCVFVIQRGRFKVATRDPQGQQLAINVLGAPELFGEVAIVDHGVRSADVTALSTGTLLTIDRAAFVTLAHEHASIGWALAVLVARRLRQLTERLKDRSFLDVEQRLAKRLHELAEDAVGIEGRVIPGTTISMSQRDLAEVVDASRERVNRQLARWSREHILTMERRTIRILNPDALRQRAEASAR